MIGLIPAGGESSRVSPLPCSKEIYPVGFEPSGKNGDLRPKAVAQYLLENMRIAGTKKVFFILRNGKWDIPSYFGSGLRLDMSLGYLMIDQLFGVPYTLDSAFPFVEDQRVVFGFPDIIFEPKNAFVQLLKRQLKTRADLVLGLFPAINPEKMDMVDLDHRGRIQAIHIKPKQTELKYTWIIAVWNYTFTRFIHEFVTCHPEGRFDSGMDSRLPGRNEYFLGDVIQAALNCDLSIDHLIFNDGRYIDIGTPDDMYRAVKTHSVNTTNRQRR